jgi:hypothetical protein
MSNLEKNGSNDDTKMVKEEDGVAAVAAAEAKKQKSTVYVLHKSASHRLHHCLYTHVIIVMKMARRKMTMNNV